MYETFFGLRERPFDLTPNPRFLLMTPTHREALANLQYGLSARKGLTVLIGEAGVGKTTLIRSALEEWRTASHLVAHLNNPTLTRAEFFEYLASAFALSSSSASKVRFLAEFTALVSRRHEQGLITALVIDEAQSLSNELLEEVRLLVNIETATDKLFQVILAGQPELGTRLNQPELRQIKQRIALRCALAALDVRQVAAYVAGRLQIAGGVAAQVFTREAIVAIHHHSGGIPRVISVICDNALLAGFAAGIRPVTSALVVEVCQEFGIQPPAPSVEAPFEVVTPLTLSAGQREPAAARAAQTVRRSSSEAREQHAAAERETAPASGLFQHYVDVGKRRFSLF